MKRLSCQIITYKNSNIHLVIIEILLNYCRQDKYIIEIKLDEEDLAGSFELDASEYCIKLQMDFRYKFFVNFDEIFYQKATGHKLVKTNLQRWCEGYLEEEKEVAYYWSIEMLIVKTIKTAHSVWCNMYSVIVLVCTEQSQNFFRYFDTS